MVRKPPKEDQQSTYLKNITTGMIVLYIKRDKEQHITIMTLMEG